jgi:hypothetical protein
MHTSILLLRYKSTERSFFSHSPSPSPLLVPSYLLSPYPHPHPYPHTYFHPHHKVIFHHGTICRFYITSWFAVDFLSAFPWSIFESGDGNLEDKFKLAKTLRLFRLFRLLRVLRVSRILHRLEYVEDSYLIYSIHNLILCFSLISKLNLMPKVCHDDPFCGVNHAEIHHNVLDPCTLAKLCLFFHCGAFGNNNPNPNPNPYP